MKRIKEETSWAELGQAQPAAGLVKLLLAAKYPSDNILEYTWLDHRQTLKSWQDLNCVKLRPIFVFILTTIGAFFPLFGPFGAIFWLGVKFIKCLGTYLCRQSTLVLEILPYLFVFTSAKFWAFLHFLGLWGLFLGLRSSSKTFLQTTNIDYQFLFWKYSPIFLFLIRQQLGPFLHFFGPLAYLFCPFGVLLGKV